MICSLCEARKAKRHCPALASEICPQCCGAEREQSIDCPLDCAYLAEARAHERLAGIDPARFPYPEVRISDTYLEEREELLTAMGRFVLAAAFGTPGVVDADVRDALDALARTQKSLESGIYYPTVPQSPVAAAVAGQLQELIGNFRQAEAQRLGLTHTRDADVLGILVFLLRMALDRDNGRRRGRSFLDFLRAHFPAESPPPSSSLIVPG